MTMASAVCASALTVSNVTPGNLGVAVGENTSEKTLLVTGRIDASDFEFISYKMTGLETLDLSGATIVSYSGKTLSNGRAVSAANVIPEYAMIGSAVKTIKLPANTVSISEAAFSGSGLTFVELPSSCTSIGAMAFKDCASLESVTLGGVSVLPDDAFSGCVSLTKVAGVENITKIGVRAFKGCSALENVSFAKTLSSVGEEAFAKSGLKSADLSKTAVTVISKGAFAECGSLEKILLPESLENIHKSAFFGDEALTEFNFPSSLETIGDFGMYGLKKLSYPMTTDVNNVVGGKTSLASIGRYGMADCESMRQFSLPSSIEFLGDNAMAGWTSFVDLLVRNVEEAPELGENVWEGVDQPNVYLYVTDSNEASFAGAEQWKEFNFTHSTTGAEQVITEDLTKARIAVWFDASVINISAKQDILSAKVYDTTGCMLADIAGDGDSMQIATSQWQSKLYIVYVTLTDGTATAVKIARI